MSEPLIKISEYKLRKWGKNVSFPTNQAIRNMINRGELPAEKIGRDWYIDWERCSNKSANELIDRVLRG